MHYVSILSLFLTETLNIVKLMMELEVFSEVLKRLNPITREFPV